MSTVSAIIIICCLVISAALTVIVILVTVPSEDTDDLHRKKLWDIQESTQKGNLQRDRDPISGPDRGLIDYPRFDPAKKALNKLNNQSTAITALTTTTTTAATTIVATFTSAAERHPPSVLRRDDEIRFTLNVAPTFRSTTTAKITAATAALTPQATTNEAKLTVTSKLQQSAAEKRRPILTKPQVTTSAIPQRLRQNLATITLRQHIQQLLLKEFVPKNKVKEVEVIRMELLREVKFPKAEKIVGLALESGLLYVGTSTGRVRVLNTGTGEQMEEFFVGDKADRIAVTHSVDIIVLNGTDLVSYRDGQKQLSMNLRIGGKGLSLGQNKIIMLGRSNDVIFVFSDDLKPIDEIYFKNEVKETCNFVIYYRKHYYVSCQSAILQISQDGELEEKIGAGEGTYSLGISVDDHSRIIAAVRGQPLLRVFQNGKLLRNLSAASTEEMTALWSEVLYANGQLHIVDYLTSTLKTFHYPIIGTGTA